MRVSTSSGVSLHNGVNLHKAISPFMRSMRGDASKLDEFCWWAVDQSCHGDRRIRIWVQFKRALSHRW